MNTNKVFIGELNLSLSVTYNGTLYDYFVGEGVEQVVKRKSVNYIIAKKISGKRVKDLKTKKYILLNYLQKPGNYM